MRKSWIAIVLALVMIFALVACGTTESTDSAASDASDKKVLYAGSSAGMFGATNLDPAVDWNGWFLSFAGVTETLFKLDDAYNAVPVLVEDVEEPEDGVTWVFTLRDDVNFSNGEKMTAQSVVDCFERTLKENERGETTLQVKSMKADGQELTIVTPEPDPSFLYNLCDPLMSVYYVGKDEDYAKESHCTGPFVVTKFTQETEMVLKANEDYWGGDVKLDEAHLLTFADDDAMVLAMQNGELDLCDGTANSVKVCNEDAGFHVLSSSTSRAEKIIFNFAGSDFAKDDAIREAIAWSIDREGYERISGGTKLANWGIYPKTMTYGDNSKLDIHIKKQDLDAAAKVLDDAGYKDTDNDGIREMNGKKISLKLATSGSANEDFVDVLASDLKSIGIEMTSQNYQNLDSFETYQGVEWDMSIEGKYMTPTGNASYFFDQDVITDGSTNYGGYSNPELDKLADELRKTFDEDDRNELVFEMEQMLLDDNSFIVFCNGTNTYITSDRVSGYAPNPSTYYYPTAAVDLDA